MNPFAVAHRLGAALVLLASLLLPFAAAAAGPPERVVRIGYLGLNPPLPNVSSARLPLALAKLGYIEGKNLVIEVRHAGGNPDRLAEAATRSIPIVAWAAHGAVETGWCQACAARAAT